MIIKFCNSIDKIINNNDVLLIQLQNIRDLLRIHLMNNDFRLECTNLIVESIENAIQANVEWREPTLFYHEKFMYSIRLIFWPAFYENNPHQHKTWSVTGILHNTLVIKTYDLINTTQLKRNRSILANTGEVGFLLPGCIHNVNNPSHELSASFHIFNNIDVNHPEENAIWYPAPRRFNLSQGNIERALLVCLKIAKNELNNKSFNIVKRIFKIAPPTIKFNVIESLHLYDRDFAKMCFDELVD